MPIRTISGIVGPDGKIESGSGFTVRHTNVGVYEISFDRPFDLFNPDGVMLEVLGFQGCCNCNNDDSGYRNSVGAPAGYGDRAIVVSANSTGFKYFTFTIASDRLFMNDLRVKLTAFGIDNE